MLIHAKHQSLWLLLKHFSLCLLGVPEENLDNYMYAEYLEVFTGLCWLLQGTFDKIMFYAHEHTS